MKILVEGKAHLEGVSKKTGKDYNFNQIHYLAPARGAEGRAAQTVTLDPKGYPIDDIIVGSLYEIEFDRSGYVVDLEYMGE